MLILLKVNNINVFYGDFHVLRDVSLEVNKQENVVMLGSNGAGKSTLFKTIIGLLHPISGSIEFLGERIDKLKPNKVLEKGIVLVPEGRLIFPEMSVIENLELGAYTRKARDKKEDSLEWVFQLFPILKERKKQLAGSLSGGEQQMLAIGRALMSSPRLILLDEPSLGLAPMIVSKLFQVMEEISKSGTSILLSEQNVRLALEFCDRGYVIENGRVVMHDQCTWLLRNEHIKKVYLGL
jgi:branched-chain amino acid transport system ATP-binding protein